MLYLGKLGIPRSARKVCRYVLLSSPLLAAVLAIGFLLTGGARSSDKTATGSGFPLPIRRDVTITKTDDFQGALTYVGPELIQIDKLVWNLGRDGRLRVSELVGYTSAGARVSHVANLPSEQLGRYPRGASGLDASTGNRDANTGAGYFGTDSQGILTILPRQGAIVVSSAPVTLIPTNTCDKVFFGGCRNDGGCTGDCTFYNIEDDIWDCVCKGDTAGACVSYGGWECRGDCPQGPTWKCMTLSDGTCDCFEPVDWVWCCENGDCFRKDRSVCSNVVSSCDDCGTGGGGGNTPVKKATWGEVKARYR